MLPKFINFFDCPQTKKNWGHERIITNNSKYCVKILHYNKVGNRSSGHIHLVKDELFFVKQGSFLFKYKDESGIDKTRQISEGDIVRIEPGTPHQLTALEDDSEIFEISTPDTGEIVRIEPGDNQK